MAGQDIKNNIILMKTLFISFMLIMVQWTSSVKYVKNAGKQKRQKKLQKVINPIDTINATGKQIIINTIDKVTKNEKMQNILFVYKDLSNKVNNDTEEIELIQNSTQQLQQLVQQLFGQQKVETNGDGLEVKIAINTTSYENQLKDLQNSLDNLNEKDFLFQQKINSKMDQNLINKKLNSKLNNLIDDVFSSNQKNKFEYESNEIESQQNDTIQFNNLFRDINNLEQQSSQSESEKDKEPSNEIEFKINKKVNINHIQDLLKKQVQFLKFQNTSNDSAVVDLNVSQKMDQSQDLLKKQQYILANYEFADKVYNNYSSLIQNIDFDTKKLFDQNYKNKQLKINLENYLNNQIKILQASIEDQQKIHKYSEQLRNLMSESSNLQKYLYNNETQPSQMDMRRFKEVSQTSIESEQNEKLKKEDNQYQKINLEIKSDFY